MYTLDPSLHYVVAAEQNVVAVYRSTCSASTIPAGMKHLPSEAYICAIREESGITALLAFLDPASRKWLIFTRQQGSRENDTYDDHLKQALAFTEALGFGMENVNLDYSRALREVIVRSIPVLRTSKDEKKPVQGKVAPVKKGYDGAPAKRPIDKSTGQGIAHGKGDRTGGGAVKTGSVNRSEDVPHDERSDQQHAGVEREKLLAEKAAAEQRAEEQAEAARYAMKMAEAERLEREKLLAEKIAADQRAAEQAEVVQRAIEKAEIERAEREKLQAEKASAEQRAEEQAGIVRVALEKADSERAEREKLLAEKEAALQLALEQAEAARQAWEKAEAERAEHEKLLAEKVTAEKQATERAEVVSQALQKAEAERIEWERLLTERADAERAERGKEQAAKEAAEKREAEKVEAARREHEKVQLKYSGFEKLLEEKALAAHSRAEEMEAARKVLEIADAERVESEQLFLQKREAEKQLLKQAEESRRKLKEAGEDRARTENLLREKAVAEKRAEEQIEAVRLAWVKAETERVECEQLLSEKLAAEKTAAEQLEATQEFLEAAGRERAERESILAEKSGTAQRALKEIELIRQAWERAEAERTEAEKRLADLVSAGAATTDAAETALPEQAAVEGVVTISDPVVLVEAMETVEEPAVQPARETVSTPAAQPVPVTKGISPFENPVQHDHETEFAIEKNCTCIQYGQDDCFVELYCSSNLARASMEDYPAQNCSAILCALENKGNYRVHIVFYLTESDKVIIYSPDRQPETFEESEGVVRKGLDFVETVGFMMDRAEIERKRGSTTAVEEISALRRVLCKT